MNVKYTKHTAARATNRLKKKVRIRKKVKGSEERPRLCVFRSGKHIYAQIIDDANGKTVVSASSLTVDKKAPGKEMAKLIGQTVAKAAVAKNIKDVVFDRNGFIYHGRVQALAEGAREGGLNF